MQKIVSHLWYDKEAKEAASFYVSLFEDSKLTGTQVVKNPPPLDPAEIISFELAGQQFKAINAGPYFKINTSISLMVACSTFKEVDSLWEKLSEGGIELMPLKEYPFSKRYAWIQDRYGLSWQLILVEDGHKRQKITPSLLFSGISSGRAEEAIRYYVQTFKNSQIRHINRYAEGEAKTSKAQVNYSAFTLDGFELSAMDNAYEVDFSFNEAFSLIVNCKDQSEIDYFWKKLSAVPEAENCGWCKDQFGVSWQILPSNWEEILFAGTEEEIERVTEIFLKMKKFDIEVLDAIKRGH